MVSLIRQPDAAALAEAAAALRAGLLVAMPTETVYGLAGHALDATAAGRIFHAKARPAFDPLIVHVPSLAAAESLVTEMPPLARRLAEAFWPGPLTLVLPKRPSVPDLVTSGLASVALRVPAHPVAQALLQQAGLPLAAPSANRFGGISPTTAAHVAAELADAADLKMILDGGPCPRGVESTIVRVDGGRMTILRLGSLSLEELETHGPLEVKNHLDSPPDDASEKQLPGGAVPGAGMTERHYAPQTPLQLVDSPEHAAALAGRRVGLLCFSSQQAVAGFGETRVLSPAGDLVEAAARLFAAMRELDALSLDRLVAIALPEHSVGRAINDRLRRASAPKS